MAGTRLYVIVSFLVPFLLLIVASLYYGLILVVGVIDVDAQQAINEQRNEKNEQQLQNQNYHYYYNYNYNYNDPLSIYLFHQGGRRTLMKEQTYINSFGDIGILPQAETICNITSLSCTNVTDDVQESSASYTSSSSSSSSSRIIKKSTAIIRIVTDNMERANFWQSIVNMVFITENKFRKNNHHPHNVDNDHDYRYNNTNRFMNIEVVTKPIPTRINDDKYKDNDDPFYSVCHKLYHQVHQKDTDKNYHHPNQQIITTSTSLSLLKNTGSMLICEDDYNKLNDNVFYDSKDNDNENNKSHTTKLDTIQQQERPELIFLSTGLTLFYPSILSFSQHQKDKQTGTEYDSNMDMYIHDFERIIRMTMLHQSSFPSSTSPGTTSSTTANPSHLVDISIILDVDNDDDDNNSENENENDNFNNNDNEKQDHPRKAFMKNSNKNKNKNKEKRLVYNAIKLWWQKKHQEQKVTHFSYCNVGTVINNRNNDNNNKNKNKFPNNDWIAPVVHIYDSSNNPYIVWEDDNNDFHDDYRNIVRIKKKKNIKIPSVNDSEGNTDSNSTFITETEVNNSSENVEVVDEYNVSDSDEYYISLSDITKMFISIEAEEVTEHRIIKNDPIVLSKWILFYQLKSTIPNRTSQTNIVIVDDTDNNHHTNDDTYPNSNNSRKDDRDDTSVKADPTDVPTCSSPPCSSNIAYRESTNSYFGILLNAERIQLQQEQQEQQQHNYSINSDDEKMYDLQRMVILENTLTNLFHRSIVLHSCYGIPTGDDGTVGVHFVDIDDSDTQDHYDVVDVTNNNNQSASRGTTTTKTIIKQQPEFQLPAFYKDMTHLFLLQERYNKAVELLNQQYTLLLSSSSYRVPITEEIAQRWIRARDRIHNGTMSIQRYGSNNSNSNNDNVLHALDCFNDAIHIITELRYDPVLSTAERGLDMPIDQYIAILSPLVLPLLLPLFVTLIREIRRYRDLVKKKTKR